MLVGANAAVALEAGCDVLDELTADDLKQLTDDDDHRGEGEEVYRAAQGHRPASEAAVDQAADQQRQDGGEPAGNEHGSERDNQPVTLRGREFAPKTCPELRRCGARLNVCGDPHRQTTSQSKTNSVFGGGNARA